MASEEQKEKWRNEKKRTYQTRRDTILKNRYGIMEFDYEQLAQKQNNKCAICGIKPETKRLDLDHCHSTKKIRGLLCNNCNRGLGHFKDDTRLLDKAKTYLINAEQLEIPTIVSNKPTSTLPEKEVPAESNWGSDWVDDGV